MPNDNAASVRETAVVLADGLLQSRYGKTSHALIRGPSRFPVAAVVDSTCAGRDAGELLDGRQRGIPVVDSVAAALAMGNPPPAVCVLGVATPGGVLPDVLRRGLIEAAEAGLTLVNGLHQLLSDLPELVQVAERTGARIVDLRKPRPTSELRFWSGEVLELDAPRLAVLGTDCAVGKRTTCVWLTAACRERGIPAEMIYTGQTGWLLGLDYGFILDATPNDFVSGELEGAILRCHRETSTKLILLEGQSALRNPTGPCGSEFLLSGAARAVVLQHALARRYYTDTEQLACKIPPVADEVELIRRLGAEVWGVTLNAKGVDTDDAERYRSELAAELGIPVVLPLRDGVGEIVDVIAGKIGGAS